VSHEYALGHECDKTGLPATRSIADEVYIFQEDNVQAHRAR